MARTSTSGGRGLQDRNLAALAHVARQVDSVIGGRGEGPAGGVAEGAIPVAFWGICDIKYDRSLPASERVKLLELGDARNSRFSHHGRHIKEAFDRGFCMDAEPFKRAVLVENKKLTHDVFVQEGFVGLRPATGCYARRYAPDLAERVASDLQASAADAVVLKLCNRSCGAGVFVCPVGELDEALRHFLQPPQGGELERWFEEACPSALHEDYPEDALAESKLHYWSNECPVFMAERLCHSHPVSLPGAESSGEFDGTMRVSFALQRKRAAEDRGPQGEAGAEPLELHWLGGYWKLPPAPMGSSALRPGGGRSSGDFKELRDQLVSSFSGAEKRTAPVPEEQLREVFEALEPALPRVLLAGGFEPRRVSSDPGGCLSGDRCFRAFVLARAAAAMKPAEAEKADAYLQEALRLVPQPSSPSDSLPERSVRSYVQRNLGALAAQRADWAASGDFFEKALELLPTNATALYLHGVSIQERGDFKRAERLHLRSFALDPDFRSPLLALGSCKAFQGYYNQALEASLACLRRHPDAYVAQYNIGQAIYQLLREGWYADEAEAKELCRRALEALAVAQAKNRVLWSVSDAEVVRYLQAKPSPAREAMRREPVNVWKTFGWRP